MSKEWKPDIDESAASRRRGRTRASRRVYRVKPGGSASIWPTLSITQREARWVLSVGIFLGLVFAFVPNLLHRMPEPDKSIPRAVERRIIAERTAERLGRGGRPIGEAAAPSSLEYGKDSPDAWDTGPDYDSILTNRIS